MHKIQGNNIESTNFQVAKPKIKEANGMKQNVKKMIDDVLKRAEREVPEYGDFAPVYEEFKNTEKTLEATDFMLKIVKPPKEITGHEKLRYLELVAYKLPEPYKVSRLIGKGSKDDILKQLKNPEIYNKIEENLRTMSKNLSDI